MSYLDAVHEIIEADADAHLRWANLQHGTAILQTEEDVDAFVACYGQMHYHKLADAMTRLDWAAITSRPFEIWDWGCGVGAGTFSVLDRIVEVGLTTQNLQSISLIEPSEVALDRAFAYAGNHYAAMVDATPIHRLNRRFDEIKPSDLVTSPSATKLHIMSNVLDIAEVNVPDFATLIGSRFSGLNHFVIVSPANNGASAGRREFTEVIATFALSHEFTNNDASLTRRIYRPFSRAYEEHEIKRKERLIRAVLV